jgi:hypothetical protein
VYGLTIYAGLRLWSVRLPAARWPELPDCVANPFPRHLARRIASGDHVTDSTHGFYPQ